VTFTGWVLSLLIGVLPLAYWPGSTSYHGLKWTLIATAAGGLMARGAWGFHRSISRRLIWVLASLLAVILATGIAARHPMLAMRELAIAWCWVVLVFGFGMIRSNPALTRRILGVGVLGMMPVCLLGFAQMAKVPGMPVPADNNLPGISTLGNQNYLGGLAAAWLYPSLALWFPWRRVGFLAVTASIVLLVTLLASRTTGAILATAAAGCLGGLGVALARRRRVAHVPRLLVAGLGAALLATAIGSVLLVGGQPRVPFLHAVADANAGDARLTNWTAAATMVRNHPGLGVGPGHYQVHWIETRAQLTRDHPQTPWAQHRVRATRAHHDWLQWLAETGLLGLIWGVMAIWVIGRELSGKRMDVADHALGAGIVTSLSMRRRR